MLGRIRRGLGIIGLWITTLSGAFAEEPYDVVLRGGRIVDGCGTPWYLGDVAIRGGRIVAMGRLVSVTAGRTIDATGLVVAPGFIDMMGQSARALIEDAHGADNLLTQGITTINAGEGESDAPLAGDEARRAGWATMAEYFDRLDRVGMPMNVVQTVGHTQVRSIVIGDVDRQAMPEELERMKGLVREAMEAGAIGLSTSLIYPPAVYASTDEIIALDQAVATYGGRYYTHMRNEGDRLLEAIDEALAIGKAAGTPVHIFHLKAAGRANWPKMEQALARIKAARDSGQVVGADIYPYINNGLGLAALIHPRHSAEGAAGLRKRLDDPAARAEIRHEMETQGNWENWFRHVGSDWDKVVLGALGAPPYAEHNGTSLGDVARAVGQDPWDVFFAVVKRGASAMPESMTEANVIKAMRQEFVSFDTDMGPAGTTPAPGTHPRGYDAFPRVLGRYVRDLGVLSLEGAVQRMTAVAANELMLADRGRLVPGAAADIVVFDAEHVRDRSTFAEPHRTALGIRFVLVGGQLVLEDGKPNGARPGRVLRGPGYRARGSAP